MIELLASIAIGVVLGVPLMRLYDAIKRKINHHRTRRTWKKVRGW